MMSLTERQHRFEELDAGRALGDLDAAELAEWQQLASEFTPSSAFDQIAAALECAVPTHAPLPASLAARLVENLPDPPRQEETPRSLQAPDPRPSIAIFPWLGWAVAACLLALFALRSSPPDSGEMTAAEQLTELLSKAPDALRLSFSPASDPYQGSSGEVVWSDSRQEGFMTFTNLPSNDPGQSQYQLWIVDPTRDELPVDGGVFDIPAGSGPAVIPIRSTLPITNPAAFVITLEQPGGVVRSKQEIVVALAKT